MPIADSYDAAPSAVMRVYLHQRRVDRMRSVRRLAGWLTAGLVLVLVTMTVMRGLPVFTSPAAIVALLVGLTAWLVAVVQDFRLHSSRLDSRVCLARLDSVRRHLAVREPQRKRENTNARRAGADVLTGDDVHALHSQVRELEAEIDESEERVEQALLLGTVAASFGAVALGAAVGAGAMMFG